MAVELHLGLGRVIGQPEMIEEVRAAALAIALAAPAQILDDRLGMHLFLQVEGRRVGGDMGRVHILAPPDQLRIEVRIAPRIGRPDGRRIGGVHHRRELRRGNVHAVGVMGDRLDPGFLGVGHWSISKASEMAAT